MTNVKSRDVKLELHEVDVELGLWSGAQPASSILEVHLRRAAVTYRCATLNPKP